VAVATCPTRSIFDRRRRRRLTTEPHGHYFTSILRLIKDVPVLIINLGTNFAPEHLTELAYTQRPKLNRIELRFRPYVDKGQSA
jgi:hypothetical protein